MVADVKSSGLSCCACTLHWTASTACSISWVDLQQRRGGYSNYRGQPWFCQQTQAYNALHGPSVAPAEQHWPQLTS